MAGSCQHADEPSAEELSPSEEELCSV